MKTIKAILVISVCAIMIFSAFAPLVIAAWDKDVPAATLSLRSSNPLILSNQSAIQTSLGAEHDFGDSTQTGSHTPGSARAFFQDAAPTTQIDGGAFAATDLGSLWFDTNATPDNLYYVLTATTPTWTLVSTSLIAEIVATANTWGADQSLAAGFDLLLSTTSDITVSGNTFTVAGATGATVVQSLDIAGTVVVVGTIDDDSMDTATNTNIVTGESLVAFATLDADGELMHDAEGGFNNADVDGTKTKVYTLYLTGTLDADTATDVAHGITGIDKILAVNVMLYNDAGGVLAYYGIETHLGASGGNDYLWYVDGTNIVLSAVGANFQGNNYRIKLDYIL